jgi:signal transduction histidine kinase/ligand-binding sensor domain-containing protein/CheY-like chemotaxis protein
MIGKNMKKFRLGYRNIFILIMILSAKIYSQGNIYEFENITNKQGLSQAGITCIIQDKQGFIWLGTQDGIDKYDGYSMIVYKYDANNLNSYPGGQVLAMLEDSKEILWVGSDLGLNKFQKDINRWVNYKYDKSDNNSLDNDFVTALYEDSEGNIWIGTRTGLNKYDRQRNCFIRYPNVFKIADKIYNPSNTGICGGNDDKLWLSSTETGLIEFDKKSGNIKNYMHDPKNTNTISENFISSMVMDNEGNLWALTSNSLDKYIVKDNIFIHYKVKNRAKAQQTLEGSAPIYIDRSGRILFAASDGLKIFNKEKNAIETFSAELDNYMDSKNNTNNCIYEDKSGILWLGTFASGIYKYDKNKNKFFNIKNTFTIGKETINTIIWGFLEDDKGILLFPSQTNGLIKYDRNNNKYSILKMRDVKNHNRIINNSFAIFKDRSKNIWLSSENDGLFRLNKKTMQVEVFCHDQGNPASISDNRVLSFFEDKNGALWIGTRNGLNKFDQEKKIFLRYGYDSTNLMNQVINGIYCMCEDAQENLWVGTRNTLFKFSKEKGNFTPYLNDPNDVNSIVKGEIATLYPDSNNNLWIGGLNGLDKLEISNGKFTHFTEKNGLPNNCVYSILSDNSGNLWLSTNKGISKYNIKNNTFQNYDESDGLQGNEFNQQAFYKAEDGEIFFGGTNGISCFYPDNIKTNNVIPPIVITSIKKFDQPCTFDKDISEIREIEIDYAENFFSFEFSALNYSNTQKNQYAYRMEGFDKDWIHCGTKRTASYTNLDPGEYIFRVKGSNNDGLWNEAGAAIKVKIKPPYWMTWWFRSSGGLLILCVGFFAISSRIKSIKKRAIFLELQVEERTKQLSERTELIEHQNKELIALKKDLEIKADQAEKASQSKSEFLANMSHEIRTPMNAILGFAEILSNKAKDAEFKNYTSIILSSGNALLTIINDILDLSKIEAGKLELQPSYIDLGRILQEIKQLFTQKVTEKGLELKTEINDNFPEGVYLDEVRIRQIIMNLTGNAVKFTEKGYIKISIFSDTTFGALRETPIVIKPPMVDDAHSGPPVNLPSLINITITIEDTGIGIPPEQLEKIFKPFEQVEGQSTRKFGGTGLGLSISTRLIQMMGGNIAVESMMGKGSKFIITLPDISTIHELDNTKELEKTAELEIEFNPCKILVVDDISSNRELVKVYLDDYGLYLEEAESGEQAIQKLKDSKYDLILLDRKMPGIGGEEAAIIIKKDENTKNIPVILLTVSALREEEAKLRSISDSYLTKPVNKINLIRELKKYLKFNEKTNKTILDTTEKINDRILTDEEKTELVKTLKGTHYPEWEKVYKTKAMGNIRIFGMNLKSTAEKYGCAKLQIYSDELLNSVNLFKIAKVKSLLNEFPKIIETLINN